MSGYTCVKCLFFGFNVMFWLLGCGILGVGIWLHIAKGSYASVTPSVNFLSVTALCIAAGLIVLVVGFFGCGGAIMENQCMLLTYFLLVVLIFVIEIVAGVLGFVYSGEICRLIKTELKVGISSKYDQAQEQGLTEAWDTMQAQLSCCGVNNYTDWYGIKAWPGERRVPESCCIADSPDNCQATGNLDYWHQRGCMGELQYVITQNLYIIGVVAVSIAMLQVLGMVAAMALFCCVRNDKRYS